MNKYTEADIPTLVNIRNTDDYDVYIGRENGYRNLEGSKWGNPIKLKRESDRLKVLEEHMEYLKNNQELLNSLHELSGKKIACWCVPKLCHSHNIIKMYKKIVLGIEE